MKHLNIVKLILFILIIVSCKNDIKKENTSVPIVDSSLTTKTVDVFEKKFGIHEGKRRNHISGFCFSGDLTLKDPAIKKLTTNGIFSEKALKVNGRFSHKGGVKKDESGPGEYGMAFEVLLENGNIHKFSMNTLDFFPVSSPEGFLQLMEAKVSGKAEDFDKLKKDHPEFKNFKTHYKSKPKVLKNYANHQFNSVNTFYLENDKGIKTAIRWSFVPKNEIVNIDTTKEVNFYKDLEKTLTKNGPLVWEMVITIANTNDSINDSAIMWTGKHKTIVAATLTINAIAIQGACDNTNFDPLQLQKGILPSDDPVLKFRSPTYATSFIRRMQENRNK
ncbi:catalase [Aquimarina latercula]|uniref:catalase n=1 Tax=Aquimarina latercula TaxID=987 RepID=UPI0003F679CE|nr:catalase [Aquimarina latercula]